MERFNKQRKKRGMVYTLVNELLIIVMANAMPLQFIEALHYAKDHNFWLLVLMLFFIFSDFYVIHTAYKNLTTVNEN